MLRQTDAAGSAFDKGGTSEVETFIEEVVGGLGGVEEALAG